MMNRQHYQSLGINR
ncbi:hypothetical protein Ahy_A02g007489 isoform E [Arachis hypogaea]|uniref:Uncharacterized protein n=1 Tax=Arachis hypogaea TaxID=3818 RepID=A0A445ECM5_ARAHY|nr:hypothetical protein Ahy_A02g007489 isoform E [Arachis hypogaea]